MLLWQGKAREALGVERKKALEVSDEVDVVRNTLAKGANDLAQSSAENRIAKDNLDNLRWARFLPLQVFYDEI